jgi:hypothetical protein
MSDESRKYNNDVFYEVWRRGGDPDRIDCDRVADDRYDGLSASESASAQIERQRPAPELPSEEEYFEQQDPEDQP